MNRIIAAAAALAIGLASMGAIAAPKQCRDAHGKFMKCPTAAAKHCKDAHGKFAKCSAPGAKPA